MSKKQITCPHCQQIFDLSDSMSAHIREQIRTKEFDEEVENRIAILKESAKLETDAKVNEALLNERERFNKQLDKVKTELSDSKSKIAELKSTLDFEKDSAKKSLEFELKQQEFDLRAQYAAENADLQAQLKAKDLELGYYKDLKSKMSTKMVGETLERHCETEFNKIRAIAFPNAEFGKDNVISKETGSKGDYIFRESVDGIELLSIMFEMKNETDTASVKKTNESFLKELNKDRNEKKCEYAVLVSLLEPDNELYNQGIVDMSHLYPKTYVIRPQFFVTLIGLLRNAALNSLESRQELQRIKNQNLDIANFKDNFEDFKNKFIYNSNQSENRLDDAVSEIDKAIKRLEVAKAALEQSRKRMHSANDKLADMTVEKLCKDSPSVKKQLNEVKAC